MHVFYNPVEMADIDEYKEFISEVYDYRCGLGSNPGSFKTRIYIITEHRICKQVQEFLEKQLNVSLTLERAELQVWPVGGHSEFHKHEARGRDKTDYNSLLYLNEDFEGGIFYTEDIKIRPRKNMLTFFDGRNIMHGVTKVEGPSHRYTIIFWWENTKFNGEYNARSST